MAPRKKAADAKVTPAFKKKFLKLLSEVGNVSKCCQALSVSRPVMYNHKLKDPKFEQGWAKAQDMAIELLEDESFRRAFEGIEKDVWYKGEVVGQERHYSDTLLMNRLQAEKPDKYQYRQNIKHTGSLDLNVVVDFVKSSKGDDDTGD